MTEVLPKKRNRHGSVARHPSSVVQDLAKQGRVISGRAVSKSKRVMSSRGEVHEDTSFAEDAIDFDLNKNTIMSNFEEWIKLSTDNKITSKNSWQFALIDYFHDLNVIKDGDDINFQKASATLDGCVKIYSSRVESVATETGKLLSGLANKKGQHGEDGGDDAQEDADADNSDDNEDGEEGKKARKINRVVESTLVKFDTIRIKKLDQELAIDPLFKKALAEFDEGGAKSLLLNTLSIDKTGRVVFDATTTKKSGVSEETEGAETQEPDFDEMKENTDANTDLGKIEAMLFGKNDDLDSLTICPSMDQLKVVVNDIDQAKSILSDVNNKFMNGNDEQPPAESQNEVEAGGFDFDEYNNDDFGNANDNDIDDYDEDGAANLDNIEDKEEEDEDEYALGPGNQILDQDLMAYFDETMKTNWRGPEHWKVASYKKARNIAESRLNPTATGGDVPTGSTSNEPKASKSKKENAVINFFDDDDIEDDILFERYASSNQLKKKENTLPLILPEDIRYNSSRLVTLFLKPGQNILSYPKVKKSELQTENQFTDASYFAEQYNQQDRMASFHQAQFEEINQDYEEDGDVFGGIDFNDALEDNENVNEGADSQNLLVGGRKVRPEFVNFSRIAKRVDIKLLKDNIWKGIKLEDENEEEPEKKPEEKEEEEDTNEESTKDKEQKTKQFGELVETIGKMYTNEERKDLSTSFCFICLLHLANEHGLSISTTDQYDDLRITGF